MSAPPPTARFYSRRPISPVRTTTWRADAAVYLMWGLAALLGLLAFVGLFSIGIFVLPFAVGACGVAAYTTFGRGFRPQCMSGVLLPVGLGIGWLGSWFTFVSSDSGDHCYHSNGGIACESSGYTTASGATVDTTPHRAGQLPTGLQWSHAWPYITVGVSVMLLSVAVFVVAGVAVRCRQTTTREGHGKESF